MHVPLPRDLLFSFHFFGTSHRTSNRCVGRTLSVYLCFVALSRWHAESRLNKAAFLIPEALTRWQVAAEPRDDSLMKWMCLQHCLSV
jgi:hypothetical protein